MALCGAVTSMIPVVVNDYYALCAISGAFGLFIAANYSLTSIILVELITLERFTNAYGLLLLVQGIANLMGPPLAGKWRNFVTKYFYIANSYKAVVNRDITISHIFFHAFFLLLITVEFDKIINFVFFRCKNISRKF